MRAKSLTPGCPLFIPLTWPAHVCELSHSPAQLSARHHGMLLWAKCELLESTWHIWNSFAFRVKFLSKYYIQQEQYPWKYSSMWNWRPCFAVLSSLSKENCSTREKSLEEMWKRCRKIIWRDVIKKKKNFSPQHKLESISSELILIRCVCNHTHLQ